MIHSLKYSFHSRDDVYLILDLSHDNVRVFLVSPFLAEQLVQVDGLQGAHLSRVLNQLVQVALLGMLALLAFASQIDASLMACFDSLLAFLLVPHGRHRAQLIEHFGAESRHFFHMFQTVVHFGTETRVLRQHFLGF